MVDLVWHDFLEIGVDFIDNDHRLLLGIMQGVKSAIEIKDYSKCSVLLDELLIKAAEHFRREEEFLSKIKYPGLAEHKVYHGKLILEAKNVKSICENISEEHNLSECFESMAKFLIDDILRGDIKFKSYLEYEGYIEEK